MKWRRWWRRMLRKVRLEVVPKVPNTQELLTVRVLVSKSLLREAGEGKLKLAELVGKAAYDRAYEATLRRCT